MEYTRYPIVARVHGLAAARQRYFAYNTICCIQDTIVACTAFKQSLACACARPSACLEFTSVLNHSTLEFRDFSKRAPAVEVMLDRCIFER